MADQDRSISEFPSGTLVAGSLFPMASPSGQSYESGSISAAALGTGMLGDLTWNTLQTANKTVIGAINEMNTVSSQVGYSTTGTLTAGSTSITLSNANIHTSSILDFYTDTFGVDPTGVTVAEGSVTLTFKTQASDLGVKVIIRGVTGGS